MQLIETKPIGVFLVDDHKTVLWGLERLIESTSPQMGVVGMAENCEELFSKLAAAKPDLILLDLDLGGTNSLDCLEKLKACSSARVLILTGSSDPGVHHHAVVHGARGVVHKQVAANVLLRAIEKVYQGEIWLDHNTLGRVMTTLSIGGQKSVETRKLDLLTNKQRQIVLTVAEQKSAPVKVIAEKLFMSEHTLRNHLTAIYDKLQVTGRMELYLYAVSHMQSGELV